MTYLLLLLLLQSGSGGATVAEKLYLTYASTATAWYPVDESGNGMPLMASWLGACSCASYQQPTMPSGAFLLEDGMQIDLFEEWRAVLDHEGYYEVSSWGRVRSLPRNGTVTVVRIMTPKLDRYGYLVLGLRRSGVRKYIPIHTMVAAAFIGPRPEGMTVNHIDLVKTNNRASNLEYLTRLDNFFHGVAGGRILCGEDNPMATLNKEQVKAIRHEYVTNATSYRKLGQKYGVSKTTIGRIIHRTIWAHIE